ncbi:hypothetical protein EMCRGX_G025326 [Ephydatia muelleri]
MTHGPPVGHGDLCKSGVRAGCVDLLATVQKRVKPKYHVFGHVHSGYGATTDGHTIFVNCSICDTHYKPVNSPEGTTQGDPLAMAMYAIATVPLIEKLQSTNTKQVWYANDATAGGTLLNLKAWWTTLSSSGPSYGYFVNPGKTWLIVKPQHERDAKELFSGTGIELFISNKVKMWTSTILNLSLIAKTQPHAAYCAFVHGDFGLSSFAPYLTHLHIFSPLKMRSGSISFLPSQDVTASVILKGTFSLFQARLGGLALPNPTASASFEYSSSVNITAPLVSCILSQCMDLPHSTFVDQKQAKATIHSLRQQLHSSEIVRLKAILPPAHVRSMDLYSEKGASSWLSVLPISDHGFALHKGAFHDAMCLRYLATTKPTKPLCLRQFFQHRSCTHLPDRWFSICAPNYLRDFTANLLTELPSAYRIHEHQKQRSYDQRVREIEHGSFTPLVFTTSGGMGKCASVTYKRLASVLSTKQEQNYDATIA